ncbi:MAG: hypothetical protein KDE53_12365 [Caldilineaceae bacterium]|nr:hypothetical protein [Caldilineaceae bacterium]
MIHTPYQTWFERHYTATLSIIRYFFTQLADEAIEIAARAVMLFAPLPNAISMFKIVQREQEFTTFQAFAFSLTLEIVVFLLVEIALVMWNGYLVQPRVYRWPFSLMTGVVLLATSIVVMMVATLEPHRVMAWLPVLSLCSFVAIGLKRWHERSNGSTDSESDLLQNEFDNAQKELNQLQTEYDIVLTKFDSVQIELDRLRKLLDLSTVLSELSETQRDNLTAIVKLVSTHRITGPADILKVSDMSKGTAYSIWPVAVASRMIYRNGDGAFHSQID